MMRSIIVLSLALLLVACKHEKEYSGNPIVEGWYADPEGVVFDDEYWIYPTLSDIPFGADSTDFPELKKETRAIHQVYNIQTYMDAFSSKDMVHWTKHPKVLSVENIKWLEFALWAPSIVRDDDGSYYMYYGGWHHCNMVKLSSDLLSLVPFDDGSYYKSVTPENYVEGPFMLKRNNKYYFMWSEGSWGGSDYSVAYAIADSPFGPFERIGKILQQDESVGTGAGHHSVIQIPGKDEWYIVYHRHPLGDTIPNHREICIDRMYFDENGFIKPVKMTFDGVGVNRLTD